MQFHHRLRAMPKQTRTSAGSRFSTCNFIIHKREREREREKNLSSTYETAVHNPLHQGSSFYCFDQLPYSILKATKNQICAVP